ncbi:hypothetical protein D3C87_2001700 [compost metagenome]
MLIRSPTFTGRSVSRINPDTKFLTISCKPKPIPTDNALTIQARFVHWTPNEDNASRMTST